MDWVCDLGSVFDFGCGLASVWAGVSALFYVAVSDFQCCCKLRFMLSKDILFLLLQVNTCGLSICGSYGCLADLIVKPVGLFSLVCDVWNFGF